MGVGVGKEEKKKKKKKKKKKGKKKLPCISAGSVEGEEKKQEKER